MSVVIVGGNERMKRQYEDMCRSYNCSAKIYLNMNSGLKNIGTPDLMVLFTGTVSHKMVKCVLSEAKGQNIKIARSHNCSMSALKSILEEHAT